MRVFRLSVESRERENIHLVEIFIAKPGMSTVCKTELIYRKQILCTAHGEDIFLTSTLLPRGNFLFKHSEKSFFNPEKSIKGKRLKLYNIFSRSALTVSEF